MSILTNWSQTKLTGIMGIVRITRDVHEDIQFTRRNIQRLEGEEGRDRRGEVDAVDKDIMLYNFLEWSSFCCLFHIPLENVGTVVA